MLHIFPGIPATWEDVGFHQLRAGGGLLVSANRTAGSTKFVRILSERGGTTKFRVHEAAWEAAKAPPTAIPSTVKITGVHGSQGEWMVTLAKNESVVVYIARDSLKELVIAPLDGNTSEYNYWGYTKEMQPLH
eukprot:SAG31_NODE_7107_length_1786_cov_1.634262_2_plen_133_part_00